jgi:hypothetical protein
MKKIMLKIISISFVFIGCGEDTYNAFPNDSNPIYKSMQSEEVVGWIDYKKDSDKDGVPDYLDKCANTKIGVKIDKNGCMIDSDKDGIADNLDKCPNTPQGMRVNFEGCPILKVFKFKKNDYKIDKKYYPEIAKLAKLLKTNKKLKIQLEAFSKDKKLKELKDILVNKFKIEANRITIFGCKENKNDNHIIIIDKSNYKQCKNINCIVK